MQYAAVDYATKAVRVLVVMKEPAGSALSRVLETDASIRSVPVDDIADALRITRWLQPDVIVIDIDEDGPSAIVMAPAIGQELPDRAHTPAELARGPTHAVGSALQ